MPRDLGVPWTTRRGKTRVTDSCLDAFRRTTRPQTPGTRYVKSEQRKGSRMSLRKLSGLTCVTALLAMTGCAGTCAPSIPPGHEAGDGMPPGGPRTEHRLSPPEAIQACAGKKAGDSCTITMPGKEALAGVCDLPPPPKARPGEGVPAKDGASKNEAAPMQPPLACRPVGMPPPIPGDQGTGDHRPQ